MNGFRNSTVYLSLRRTQLFLPECTRTKCLGDGLTIMERGIVEHNMIAVSKIYESIYISELARAVGVTAAKAEKIAATMIMDGSLSGTIDQVEGLVVFDRETFPNATWDKNISAFCVELNRITDVIQSLS
jgi:COP9 signalosome complex subunit 4